MLGKLFSRNCISVNWQNTIQDKSNYKTTVIAVSSKLDVSKTWGPNCPIWKITSVYQPLLARLLQPDLHLHGRSRGSNDTRKKKPQLHVSIRYAWISTSHKWTSLICTLGDIYLNDSIARSRCHFDPQLYFSIFDHFLIIYYKFHIIYYIFNFENLYFIFIYFNQFYIRFT